MSSNVEYISAMEKIIRYIGISKKTEFEVFKKLQALKLSKEEIRKIIQKLKDLEYIDDNMYVKLYIKQNINMQKYSKYEIKQKLLAKGINKDEIDKQIVLLDNNQYEAGVVKKLLKSKLKNHDKIKQKEYLYRRGFKLEEVNLDDEEYGYYE